MDELSYPREVISRWAHETEEMKALIEQAEILLAGAAAKDSELQVLVTEWQERARKLATDGT